MCTIWNGIWKYVLKTGGLFISFLPKGVKSWGGKKYKIEKIAFLEACFF